MPLSKRVTYIEKSLQAKKHVLTEFPFSSDLDETLRLMNLAKSSNLVLMEGLKTAYSPAFSKLIAMARVVGKSVRYLMWKPISHRY